MISCASCMGAAGPAKRSAGKPNEDYGYPVSGIIPALVGSSLTSNILTHSDSYFVVQKYIATSAGAFQARILESGSGVLLMDDYINNDNVFGTALRPALVLDPFVIPPSSSIVFELKNGIAGVNAFQILIQGYKHYDLANPPSLKSLAYSPRPMTGVVKWFQYSLTVNLVANGYQTLQTKIQADSNFILRKMISTQTGLFQARFSDTSTKTEWTNGYVQQPNLTGTAQRPAILHKSRVVGRNSTIQTDIQDLSGAPNTVQLVFEGAKHYV